MAEQSHPRQARRSRFGLAAMAALALGGCIPSAEPRRPPPVEEPIEVPEEPLPGTANLPGDQARNRVAVLVPLSGSNGGVGTSISNAANLALLDTGGERIRITIYDTAKGAAAAATEAIGDGNGLFLGPLLAEEVRAVAPIARAGRVPVIAYSNDVAVAGDGVYVMGFTPGQSIARVVNYARGRGVERFGALIPDGIYGRRASQAMIAAVESSGGRLVGMQTYDRSAPSLRTAVSKLNGQGEYDAVLIADSGRAAAAAVPLIRSGPSQGARILGTELWATETGLAGIAALRGAWFASASDNMFNQMRTRYRARYGKTPYRLASLGYDSVLLAVRAAANWRVGRTFPERELIDPGGFSGVDGAFRFGRDGIAERALQVQQVDAARLTVVSPAARGFGD